MMLFPASSDGYIEIQEPFLIVSDFGISGHAFVQLPESTEQLRAMAMTAKTEIEDAVLMKMKL